MYGNECESVCVRESVCENIFVFMCGREIVCLTVRMCMCDRECVC